MAGPLDALAATLAATAAALPSPGWLAATWTVVVDAAGLLAPEARESQPEYLRTAWGLYQRIIDDLDAGAGLVGQVTAGLGGYAQRIGVAIGSLDGSWADSAAVSPSGGGGGSPVARLTAKLASIADAVPAAVFTDAAASSATAHAVLDEEARASAAPELASAATALAALTQLLDGCADRAAAAHTQLADYCTERVGTNIDGGHHTGAAGVVAATQSGSARPAVLADTSAPPSLPAGLREAWNTVAGLAATGRVVGWQDWLAEHAHKSDPDLANNVQELVVAVELAERYPGHRIRVELEATAPFYPGRPTERAREFDLAVQAPDGNIVERVEVTTLKEKVTNAQMIAGTVPHAAKKAEERLAEGIPMTGALRSVTVIVPAVGVSARKGQRTVYHPDGTVVRHRPDTGAEIGRINIYDQLTGLLNEPDRQHLLSTVTVRSTDGRVLADYRRHGADWRREH